MIGRRYGPVHMVVASVCSRFPNGFFISDIIDAVVLEPDLIERCIYDFFNAGIVQRRGMSLFILNTCV